MTNKIIKLISPLALVMLLTFLMTSCQKDELTDLNPHSTETEVAGIRSTDVSGQVIQYDCVTDSWSSMPGVDVSIDNCTGTTTVSNGNPGNNYNLNNIPSNCTGGGFPLCMEFLTPANNNVTIFDNLCVALHINGTVPFTTAREFLAADVDRDGLITNADMNIMTQIRLGDIPNFPINNELFIPFGDYDALQNMVNMGNVDQGTLQYIGEFNPNCQNSGITNRRYIKTGDVNGGGSSCPGHTPPVTCLPVVETPDCANVTMEYCSDGRLTATFTTTGVVHYLKIWQTGWQSPIWFCVGGNNGVPTWAQNQSGQPVFPCTGTQFIQLDPNLTYFIELEGGTIGNGWDQYPPGTSLCTSTSNIPLPAF